MEERRDWKRKSLGCTLPKVVLAADDCDMIMLPILADCSFIAGLLPPATQRPCWIAYHNLCSMHLVNCEEDLVPQQRRQELHVRVWDYQSRSI